MEASLRVGERRELQATTPSTRNISNRMRSVGDIPGYVADNLAAAAPERAKCPRRGVTDDGGFRRAEATDRGAAGRHLRPVRSHYADQREPRSRRGSAGDPRLRARVDRRRVGRDRDRLGSFFLGEKEDGREFTDGDEDVLVLFASQAATAIANARAYRDEQRARADLQALVDTSPVGVVVFDAGTGGSCRSTVRQDRSSRACGCRTAPWSSCRRR